MVRLSKICCCCCMKYAFNKWDQLCYLYSLFLSHTVIYHLLIGLFQHHGFPFGPIHGQPLQICICIALYIHYNLENYTVFLQLYSNYVFFLVFINLVNFPVQKDFLSVNIDIKFLVYCFDSLIIHPWLSTIIYLSLILNSLIFSSLKEVFTLL